MTCSSSKRDFLSKTTFLKMKPIALGPGGKGGLLRLCLKRMSFVERRIVTRRKMIVNGSMAPFAACSVDHQTQKLNGLEIE